MRDVAAYPEFLPGCTRGEVLAEGDELALATPQFEPVSSAYFDDLDAIPPAGAVPRR